MDDWWSENKWNNAIFGRINYLSSQSNFSPLNDYFDIGLSSFRQKSPALFTLSLEGA